MSEREKVIEELMQLHGSKETMNIISNAITLLKEQEPVKPIERSGFWYCGNCRYALMTNHQKFCSDCGQEVKWE